MQPNYGQSSRKFFHWSRVFIIFIMSVSVGCILPGNTDPGPSHSTPPNVVLITIDTLRADHLGCYGYAGVKTPHIDALARQGIVFQQAYTPVPVTFPSHVSILTGSTVFFFSLFQFHRVFPPNPGTSEGTLFLCLLFRNLTPPSLSRYPIALLRI